MEIKAIPGHNIPGRASKFCRRGYITSGLRTVEAAATSANSEGVLHSLASDDDG